MLRSYFMSCVGQPVEHFLTDDVICVVWWCHSFFFLSYKSSHSLIWSWWCLAWFLTGWCILYYFQEHKSFSAEYTTHKPRSAELWGLTSLPLCKIMNISSDTTRTVNFWSHGPASFTQRNSWVSECDWSHSRSFIKQNHTFLCETTLYSVKCLGLGTMVWQWSKAIGDCETFCFQMER